MNENLRNQIIRYSFILTVFVIWLHAGEPLISSIPGQIAVPGFFLLSGFLFFRLPLGVPVAAPEAVDTESAAAGPEPAKGDGIAAGMDPVERSRGASRKKSPVPVWIREKLRRRIHTLLVPYLLWNLLYFLIYLAAGRAEITEFFAAVFHYSCNPVFWYLYQLILIMLLTPLLWLVLKQKTSAILWLTLIFLAAVFYGPIHRLIPAELINEDALFYFSLGGFSSLYLYKEEKDPGETVFGEDVPEEEAASEKASGIDSPAEKWWGSPDGKYLLASGALLLLSAALETVLPAALINVSVIGVRVSGAAAVWFLLKLLPGFRIKPWMKITFFVYATHYAVIRLVWRAEAALGLNEQAAANIATYLLMPVLCFAAAWFLYSIMKKYTPKLLALLTGGRG